VQPQILIRGPAYTGENRIFSESLKKGHSEELLAKLRKMDINVEP
jgi:hypothetical protein